VEPLANWGIALAELGLGQAVALGVLCTARVCLGVWLAFSARTAGALSPPPLSP
jgi:hypothetical protein